MVNAKKIIAICAVTALGFTSFSAEASLGAFLGFGKRDTPTVQLQNGNFMPDPQAIKPFVLQQTSHDRPFTQENLKGQWTAVFFGFTHCGYVCPTTLAIMTQAYEKLAKAKIEQPHMLFISVDPERDTTASTQRYVSGFSGKVRGIQQFTGVAGTADQVHQLAAQFSAYYEKVAQGAAKAGQYTMNHSGAIYVINPEGELYAVITPPLNADQLAHDFPAIMNADKSAS
ncbi:MAG: SCO family protein [Pseudomonadota bacterium]